jgi:YVTN family beta-propeller protein
MLSKENSLFTLLLPLLILFMTLEVSMYFNSQPQFPSILPSAIAQENDTSQVMAQKGEVLYVGNANSSNISVVDLAANKVIKNITVGSGTHDIKISDDQQTVYTTDIDSGTVSIVNATSNTLLNQIQTDMAVHGVAVFNNTYYIGDVYGGKVLVIKDNVIKNEIKVGSGPEYVEVRPPDGRVLYVANLWSPISVVDLVENRVIKEIDSGITPHGLSFTKDGSKLYIANMYSNTVSVIDAQKHEIIETIPVGNKPEYVKLSPDESFAYVTNLGENTISKIDLRTHEVMTEIVVGNGPHGIAFSADGDLAYISNMKGNDITVINTSSDKVVAIIPAGGIEPHQIVAKKPVVRIISAQGGNDSSTISSTAFPVYIDVADDPHEQERGLMFRKSLESNNGMFFVYEDLENRTFWMKNTLIPLDMIFIDNNLRIVDIKENVQPCLQENPCPSYPSIRPAKYVLEVNGGFVRENGVKIGDTLEL